MRQAGKAPLLRDYDKQPHYFITRLPFSFFSPTFILVLQRSRAMRERLENYLCKSPPQEIPFLSWRRCHV